MKRLSACTLDCPDSCSLVVDPEAGRVAGNPGHPFTQGVVCAKGAGFFKRLRDPGRITRPLLKRGGAFVPVSWDEALGLCAERIQALRGDPGRILHIKGYGYRGVLAKASKVFFGSLGAAAVHGSICEEAGSVGLKRDCGVADMNDPLDLLKARRIVNWGKDLGRSSLHTAMLVRRVRERGGTVLTVSPGCDGNGPFTDERIRVRPGADRFLAAAVIRLFLEAGNLEPGILARASNWPQFRGLVEGRRFADLCAACGVSQEDAELLYDWYAEPGPAATLLGWGVQRYEFGGQNARFVNALVFLSGNMGRSGGGLYYNIPAGRSLGSWWGPLPAPARSFLRSHLGRELLAADPAPDFVWIDGHNPVNQVPDSRSVAEGLARCGFVVAVEGFMNDTADRADLILPPAYMLETEDILGSCLHPYVHHSAQVVRAPGECRSDFDILFDLGRRLDPPVRFPTAGDCLRRGLETPDLDVSLEELRERGFARARRPALAFEGLRFGHPDGRFSFVERLDPEPGAPAQWPLRLLTLVSRRHLNSQIEAAGQDGVPRLWVSPDCPELGGLGSGDGAVLRTPLGSLAVRLEWAQDLEPGTVVMRRGGWLSRGRGANALIEARTTDLGDGTAYYSQYCRVERA